ncbi:MAG: hypothetical protein L0215_18690 [Gemmataceae bacterium]|nr:hypothetical protein [Gemmataceae bacterium]
MAETFERLGIPYRVTGSMATIAYGEPRFTNDIDVVVRLQLEQVNALCAAFPQPEFYLSKEAAGQAVRGRHQFNILHPESGLKIDVIIASDSAFDDSRFSRGQRLKTAAEQHAWFASPEDVILKKLIYFREGGSEKHLRDIAGVLKVQGEKLDRDYIALWVGQLNVETEWHQALARLTPVDERRD